MCQPVIAGIENGLARLARSARRTRLRARFDLFLAELACAPWTDEVSGAFGTIKTDLERRGVRLEDFDAAVAAHAVAIGATVVTDNVAHMARVKGLVVEELVSGGNRGLSAPATPSLLGPDSRAAQFARSQHRKIARCYAGAALAGLKTRATPERGPSH